MQVWISGRTIIRHDGGHSFQHGFKAGIETARTYLALRRWPTAVVAGRDDAAIAFMSMVRSAEVAVPGKLSVLGFDGARSAPSAYRPWLH